MLGLPIFAVFGGLALLLFWNAGTPAASVPVEMYRLVASPLLPSIPLFTLAGYFMVQGGATDRLLRVFTALFSWIPGGLAIATVAICTVFTFAGSGLTILVAGWTAGADAGEDPLSGKLLHWTADRVRIAGPAVSHQRSRDSLLRVFADAAAAIVHRRDSAGTRDGRLRSGRRASTWAVKHDAVRDPFVLREASSAIWQAKWELMLPVIMVVGLFGGFGTLTEAAALTAFCAFVVEVFIYRDLKLTRDYREVFIECATIVGGILLIMGVALGFTNYLIDAEVPAKLIDWVQAHVQSKYLFLLLAERRAAGGGRADGHLRRDSGGGAADQASGCCLRDRPGADGRDLHRQSGARLFASAGRDQSVSVGVSLQEADGHHHLGDAAVPVHPDGHCFADHLRAVADDRAAALVRKIVSDMLVPCSARTFACRIGTPADACLCSSNCVHTSVNAARRGRALPSRAPLFIDCQPARSNHPIYPDCCACWPPRSTKLCGHRPPLLLSLW